VAKHHIPGDAEKIYKQLIKSGKATLRKTKAKRPSRSGKEKRIRPKSLTTPKPKYSPETKAQIKILEASLQVAKDNIEIAKRRPPTSGIRIYNALIDHAAIMRKLDKIKQR